jgi:hypothetical protein
LQNAPAMRWIMVQRSGLISASAVPVITFSPK